MNTIEEIQEIVNNFKVPEKLHENVVLTYEVEKDKNIYTLTPISDLDQDIKLANSLDRNQQGFGSDEFSKKTSKYHKNDTRYRLQPIRKSYDLCYSETKEGKKFLEYIMKPGWICNLERIKLMGGNRGLVFSDSITYIKDREFEYEGNPVEVKINIKDVISALIEAKLFKRIAGKKVSGYGINFDNSDEASVRSGWNGGEGCFGAVADRPSSRSSYGLVAFEKQMQEWKLRKSR